MLAPPRELSGVPCAPGSLGATTVAAAEIVWPEIFATSVPGSLVALNNARPVASVVTFWPPERSTAMLANRRPWESSTASVACAPATSLGGRMIWRGAGEACDFGGCWAAATVADTAPSRVKTKRQLGTLG